MMRASEVTRSAMSLPSCSVKIITNTMEPPDLLHHHHRSVLLFEALSCQAGSIESLFHVGQPPSFGVKRWCAEVEHLVLASLDSHLSLLISLHAIVSPIMESLSS